MTHTACTLCRNRLPATPDVCEPCRTGLARTLATIPGLHADALARAATSTATEQPAANDPVSRVLPAGPVKPTVYASRTTGGPVESAAPVDLALVDLTDRRHAALAPLTAWARQWHRPGDPAPTDPVAWLQQHLDRACDQHGPDIPAFARDLNAVARELRAAARDTRQLIGYCPTEDCNAELYADLHTREVICDGCGTTWARRHWTWLADTLRAAA